MSEENKKIRNLSLMNLVAVIFVGFLANAQNLNNACMQKYIEAFPDIAVSTIRLSGTLPSVIAMFMTILVGLVVGKKIKYRPVIIGGFTLILIGGVGPYFFYTSWYVILAFRVVLGLGMGCLGIRNALILKTVDPANSARYLGFGAIATNLAKVVLQPVAGALADMNWRLSFLVYLIAVIMLIFMTLFLKEPEEDEVAVNKNTANAANPKTRGKISPYVLIIVTFHFLAVLTGYPMQSGLSTFMTTKGIGSAAIAGTMLSGYAIGGYVANLLLPKSNKILKKMIITVGYSFAAIFHLVVIYIPNIVGIAIGATLVGFGYMTVTTSLNVFIKRIADPSTFSFSAALLMSATQAGIFLSTYFISGAHQIFNMSCDIESAMFAGVIVYFVMAAIAFVLRDKICPQE